MFHFACSVLNRDGDIADFSAFAGFFRQPMQDFEWAHINYMWSHAILTEVGGDELKSAVSQHKLLGFFFSKSAPIPV